MDARHPAAHNMGEMCTNTACLRPHESSFFTHICAGRSGGGMDWSELVGEVLCLACYSQFKRRGTLCRKIHRVPMHVVQRSCTYSLCGNPRAGKKFHKIVGNGTAGGRDWMLLSGSILCTSCYYQYKTRGTLEREGVVRCGYIGCPSNGKSRALVRVDKESSVKGGLHEWAEMEGKMLCRKCHSHYTKTGKMDR
jgi:hypothetical protein